MNNLKIVKNGESTSAEFKVYSKINDNNDELNAKLILEPVTADNPIEIPLYYKESENAFYLEDNHIVDQIIIITGLICYDLGIGFYQARPYNYEVNASYEEMQNPDNQFTDFSEIDAIILSKDELAKIKDYHIIYKIDNNGATDVELIKYQRLTPKSATPKSIKGINEENAFNSIEIYTGKISGGE